MIKVKTSYNCTYCDATQLLRKREDSKARSAQFAANAEEQALRDGEEPIIHLLAANATLADALEATLEADAAKEVRPEADLRRRTILYVGGRPQVSS